MRFVLYEVKDRVATITLNRPEKRNALSEELVGELQAAFHRAANDELVKVVVLKAVGEAFCAGADLAYLQKLQHNTFEENLQDSQRLKELFFTIYTLPKVVIAQVQGHALAGGCGLSTVCDFSFASGKAKFGYTEVKIGFIPALVSVFLLRKIGEGKARQWLLSGEIFSAAQAKADGLINEVVEPERLQSTVNDFVQKIIHTNSQQSMQLTKRLISETQSLPLNDALHLAATLNAQARSTEDCRKGIAAFLSKQELKW
jgi:methylglutaconyl-CoA hydratase